MNTPASREGNLLRYIVYLLAYLMVVGVVKLASHKSPLRIWDLILFGLIALMVLLFYLYRFQREARFFKQEEHLPFFGDLSLTIILTLALTATRIFVMYFQAYRHLPWYSFQASFLKHESVSLYWFLMVAQGIVLPVLQEFLATGFLFNYLFRRNAKSVAIVGIITSASLFSLFNFQLAWPLLLIDFAYGLMFAWSYLYSQSLWLPLYLAVVNGLLMVIMM